MCTAHVCKEYLTSVEGVFHLKIIRIFEWKVALYAVHVRNCDDWWLSSGRSSMVRAQAAYK